jgi:hypothetical protein
MEARLQSSILVNALQRRAEAEGGFAAVLTKGDPTAGAVLVILAERGRRVKVLERLLEGGERYAWRDIGKEALANEADFQKFLEKRRRFDPDIWLIELDIASAERFAAEMNS